LLTPLSLFLYLIIWDINLVLLENVLVSPLFSVYKLTTTPWPIVFTCCSFLPYSPKVPSFLLTTSHHSKWRSHVLGKADHRLWVCMPISLSLWRPL
jgi:hypothetical protein